jgi:pyocin large subunit-like protein
MARDFLGRAKSDGLPTKVDADGVTRVFDPASNTFGAYNSDGSTRTFFKPSSSTYWERQPGNAP